MEGEEDIPFPGRAEGAGEVAQGLVQGLGFRHVDGRAENGEGGAQAAGGDTGLVHWGGVPRAAADCQRVASALPEDCQRIAYAWRVDRGLPPPILTARHYKSVRAASSTLHTVGGA